MKYLLLIASLVCNYIFVYAQLTPFVQLLPDSITLINKPAKNIFTKPKQPILSKIKITSMTNHVEIHYHYNATNKLTKVEYKYASGRIITDNLFYDELSRLYMIVKEEPRSTHHLPQSIYRIITYDNSSKISSVTSYNSGNRRIELSTFTYEGSNIVKTTISDPGNRTSVIRVFRTADSENILRSEYNFEKNDHQSFLSRIDPTSYLPGAYNRIFIGSPEYVWYIMEGNKYLSNKTLTENSSGKIASNINKYTINADGWVTYVNVVSDVSRSGTEFTYEYKTP
jgi:hypothetical protein